MLGPRSAIIHTRIPCVFLAREGLLVITECLAKKFDFIGERCRISFTLSPPLVLLRVRGFEDGSISGEVRPRSTNENHSGRSYCCRDARRPIPAYPFELEREISGSFNTLVFGKNKPFIGSCHDDGSPSCSGHFSEPRGASPPEEWDIAKAV